MKKQGLIFLIGVLGASTPLLAAQSAQARMYCLSLRFAQGTDDMGFFTLDLSTVDLPGSANGELAPTYDDPTHYSGFRLYDMAWDTTAEGFLDVSVPLSKDENQNGFPDFFEVSQSDSGATTGTFTVPGVDTGTVRATWSRAAGSKDGTCVIQMTGGVYGQLPAFTHSFELLEYAGTLSYTPGSNHVTGTVDLSQTGDAQNRLTGPVDFLKFTADRFNDLALQAGTWTNAFAQSLPFLLDEYLRDLQLGTNYYGYFDFEDGDLATAEPDYMTWMLSIDDVNDADKDGIPDFSDDPSVAPARRPTFSMSFAASNAQMTLSGTVGRVHEIREATSLTLKDWTTVQSVTLASDPQTVSLPPPAGAVRFWQVRVP
jgi:hypothetical protein